MDEVRKFYLPGTTICAGPTMDMQILRDLFGACIAAAEARMAGRKYSI